MSASGGTGNSSGAEAGTETALQRFIAASQVQNLHDYVPANQTRGFRVGDRVKRGTKKQVEYGYVVYLSIKDDKPSITVLWMRGAALPLQVVDFLGMTLCEHDVTLGEGT